MRRLILAAVLALAAPPALAQDAAMARLAADYDAFERTENPGQAAREGDRAALARLSDISLAGDQRRMAALEAFRGRLGAVSTASLSTGQRLNRDVLAWELEGRLRGLALDEARLAFSSDSGFDQAITYLASTTSIDSEADAVAWIARLRAVPGHYAAGMENARRGVGQGFTQARMTNEAVLARARAAAARPVDRDPLLQPFDDAAARLPKARRDILRAQAVGMIRDQIRPVQGQFVTFLEREVLPASRKDLGVRSATGGEAYYRWAVRDHTTTDLTPDQIHALGRSEVARIRAEMGKVMAETGFAGDLAAFFAMLRSDPRFYARSRQELLEKASEIAKRVDDRLPRYFATLPRLSYGVRPVPAEIEEAYTTGRYFSGSPKMGVAGGYMVNTSHLDQRALYELPALTVHEAAPGHHIQIALAQELSDLPAYRRNAGVTAFTEGWGLYSETLAGEMGIYRDPYERFGKLSYEMWRACRLIADTGIHWLGWSLEEARACFTDNTALSPLNIEVELARYVSWPGQALAYKVGELKILALRQKAREALGERFDIRRFHDAVLLNGALPLALLEQRVDAWIAAERASPRSAP